MKNERERKWKIMNWRELTVRHWCTPPQQAGRPPSRCGCRSGCRETAGPGSLRWWWAGCLPGAAPSLETTAPHNKVLLVVGRYNKHALTRERCIHTTTSEALLTQWTAFFFLFSAPHRWNAPGRMVVWQKRSDKECMCESERCEVRGHDVRAESGDEEEKEKKEC